MLMVFTLATWLVENADIQIWASMCCDQWEDIKIHRSDKCSNIY